MRRLEPEPKRFLGLDRFGWAVAGVLLLSVALYLPAMKGGPIWDDTGFIDGRTIGGGERLIDCFTKPFNLAYYRPFVSASLYLDRSILGNNTFFYHQTNVLLHVATVMLLIAIVGTLMHNRRMGLLAGLLFAVQPVQMPAVAWIGGRTDALCAFFVAAYMLALVRWSRGSGWALPVAALSFFCALMSKEQSILLFPLAPLVTLTMPKGKRAKPALLATVAVGIVMVVFLSLCVRYYPNLGGATSSMRPRGFTTFGQTCLHYTVLLLAPEPSRLFTYSLASYRPEAMWAGLGIVVLLLAGFVWVWRRSIPGGWIASASLLALLPVSNLLPVPSLLVAPYRVGVAGLPIAALMALGLWVLATSAGRRRVAVVVLAGAYVAYEATLVMWGATRYRSSQEFFATAARYDPGCIIVAQCLIRDLLGVGRADEASREAEKVLDLSLGSGRWRDLARVPQLVEGDPAIGDRIVAGHGTKVKPNLIIGELLCSYGWARERMNDPSTARLAYHSARLISPRDPHAYADEGVLVGKSDPAAGRSLILQALALDPHDSQSLSYMASDCEKRGLWREASDYYLRAAEGQPWMGALRIGAARALYRTGRKQEALAQLDLAAKAVVSRNELDAVRRQIESDQLPKG